MNRSPEQLFSAILVGVLGVSAMAFVWLRPDDVDPNLMFIVWVPVVIGLAWWSSVRIRRNGRAVAMFARQHGWTFQAHAFELSTRYKCRPFGIGHSMRFSNRAAGELNGAECTTFTYQFVTGSGKNSTTHLYTIDTVALPGWLPHLEVAPEGLGSKLAKALGAGDIDVESADFNDRWRVTAPDPRFASAVLHPRMIEFLLRPEARGTGISIDGSTVVGFYVGSRGPEDLVARLSALAGFASQIPDHVWREFGGEHGEHGGAA